MKLTLEVKQPYDFVKSVTDYGWCVLAPNVWNNEKQSLERVERLDNGEVIKLNLSSGVRETRGEAKGTDVIVEIEAKGRLNKLNLNEVEKKVRHILRLDDDLKDFYDFARKKKFLWEKIKSGRGRLLRSSTLFEDVVKVICTTNTTWTQTKGMVQRIVNNFGDSSPLYPDLHAFPTPEQVASADLDYFQKHIRLGYRNEYVLKLARDIVDGRLDLEHFYNLNLPSKELKKELKKIKGIGDYSAHTLLMILGLYDELAVDSEFRTYVKNKYFNGKDTKDKIMEEVYESWGKWKYLAFWLERQD